MQDVLGSKGDRRALHASCPTFNGTKWTATKWIHNKSYMGRYDAMSRAAECIDMDRQHCPSWAREGKCESDTEHMVGMGGLCRKSCHDCIECPAGDVLCQRKNMRSLYLANRLARSGASGAGVQHPGSR